MTKDEKPKKQPGRKSDLQVIIESIIAATDRNHVVSARWKTYYNVQFAPDPVSSRVRDIVMTRVRELRNRQISVHFDVGVQCLMACIAIVDAAVAEEKFISVSMMNAPAFLYAALRGSPFVDVNFIGSHLDRQLGLLVFPDAGSPPTAQRNQDAIRAIVERSDFVVAGAFQISKAKGICGSPQYREIKPERAAQIECARREKGNQTVLVPCDWTKLTGSHGDTYLSAEALKKSTHGSTLAENIALITPRADRLEGINPRDLAQYVRSLKELKELGITPIHTEPIRDGDKISQKSAAGEF